MTAADSFLTPATKAGRQSMAAGMVLGLIDYAAAQGANRAALLAMVGLAGEPSPDPNRRIALAHYAAMMREAARQCDDAALAIHFSEATRFSDLSIVGLIGYAAETMRDALDQLNRFGRLVTDIAVNGPEPVRAC